MDKSTALRVRRAVVDSTLRRSANAREVLRRWVEASPDSRAVDKDFIYFCDRTSKETGAEMARLNRELENEANGQSQAS